MLDNMQIGLDIATALSVVGAAIAFIWNSSLSGKREKQQRYKEIVHAYMLRISSRMYDKLMQINKRIQGIQDKILQGEMNQDLNPYKNDIYDLKFTFRYTIEPFDKSYGDGRFIKIANNFEEELNEYIELLIRSTLKGSGESFDLATPVKIANKYITEFMTVAEKYIDYSKK